MHRPGRRADAGWLLLAVLLLGRLAWLAPRLLVDDLGGEYPFAAGDAWDWIANGLFLAGDDVRFSARPPLVPLAIAALSAAGRLELFPLLVQALWTATLLVLYRSLRRAFSAAVSLAATLVVAASQVLNLLSLEVMADLPAACLLFLTLAALVVAGERPRWYLLAGGLAALAYLAAPIGLAAAAAAVAAILLRRRRHLGEPALWGGGGMLAAAVVGWTLVRRALLGGEAPLHAVWRLARFHLDDLDGMVWTAAVVGGWPASALAAVGAALAARRVARRCDAGELRLIALVATGLPFAFFALLYDFPDRRFLVYSALPAAVLVADGLAVLRPAAVRAAAMAVAVAWAAWPVPAPVARSLLVVPPGLYAEAGSRATPEGGLRIEPAAARLRRWPVGEAAWSSWWSRVAKAHPARPADPAERAARRRRREEARRAAADAQGVVFLDADHHPFDRYRAQSQLGNLLGRRVAFVPDHLFAGRWRWLAAGGVEPVAEVDGYVLWTVEPPGVGGRWLLATQAAPQGRPRQAGAAAAPAAGSGAAEPPPRRPDAPSSEVRPFFGQAPPASERSPQPDAVRPARRAAPPPAGAEARRLAAALPGRTLRVALLLPEGPVPGIAVWLPFRLETTELYVLEATDRSLGGALAEAPGAAARRFGAARLVERRWWGEPVWVIDFPGQGAATEPGASGISSQ